MLKRSFLLLSFILVVLAVTIHAGDCRAADDSKEVIASGIGGGERTKARDDAVNDALRKAVEQGMGVYVSSETLVEQMMLVEDRIYSETRGYIESYKVIGESYADGIYEIKVKAIVRLAKLAQDLEAIGLILQKKQNPRVMVVVLSRELNSSLFGIDIAGNKNAENQLESILMAKGFRLVDAGQTQRKQRLAALLIAGDPTQASRIAKDWGTEILVEAEVRREFACDRIFLGQSMRFFSNEIRLKAIEADSAKILYSGFQTRPPSGANALGPMEDMTRKLAKEMVAKVLEQWGKDVYQAAVFQINIANVNFSQANKIIAALRELRGVASVATRNFQGGHVALEIKFQGNINDLAERIGKIKTPKVEVTGLQANTLDIGLLPR